MAKNYKITQLPELKNLTGNEELVAVSGGVNVKIKTVRTSEFLTATQAISKTSLGLENVDNTSDANKPINVVAQAALDTLPDITHTHPVSDIVGLQTLINAKVTSADLAGKADAIHTHPISDITGLQTELDAKEADAVLQAKALLAHTHAIADIPGLQTSLDSKAVEADFLDKADLLHEHLIEDVTGLQLALDGKSTIADLAAKADITHAHGISDVSDLQTALNGKSDVTHTHVLADVPAANAALISIQDRLNVIDGRPHTEGLVSIYLGDAPTYLITNFDSFQVYTLSTTNGTITLTDDILTYTPAVAGPDGFTVNGKLFSITVKPGEIVTPSITNPADNTIDLNASVTLTGSAYQILPAGGESHLNTDWELATDTGFTSVVFSSYNDTVNKTDWTVNGLFSNMTYYARMRYRSASTVSNWSATISFSTLVSFGLTEEAILSSSDKAANDNIGMSVAVDATGTRVVIGAPYSSTAGALYSGKVYVFVRSGTTWTEEAILMASDRTADSILGMSVAINNAGTRLIAGAPDSAASGVFAAGKAYVFLRTGTSWAEEAILMAADRSVSASFGYSVAMDSLADRVAVGSQNADPATTTDAGSVYIFIRSGSIWTESATIAAADLAANDHFGYAVALTSSGDRLIVGAPHADPSALGSAGKVYIFSRSGTVWTQEAMLTASNLAANAVYGSSVDIDSLGDRIVVGAWGAKPGALNSAGSAYVYLRTGTSWTEETIITASDVAAESRFGSSVAISDSGAKITIGASYANVSATVDAGQFYLYERTGTSWAETTLLAASDAETNGHLGYSIALAGDGTRVALGADLGDVGGVTDSGKVYIFS